MYKKPGGFRNEFEGSLAGIELEKSVDCAKIYPALPGLEKVCAVAARGIDLSEVSAAGGVEYHHAVVIGGGPHFGALVEQ